MKKKKKKEKKGEKNKCRILPIQSLFWWMHREREKRRKRKMRELRVGVAGKRNKKWIWQGGTL